MDNIAMKKTVLHCHQLFVLYQQCYLLNMTQHYSYWHDKNGYFCKTHQQPCNYQANMPINSYARHVVHMGTQTCQQQTCSTESTCYGHQHARACMQGCFSTQPSGQIETPSISRRCVNHTGCRTVLCVCISMTCGSVIGIVKRAWPRQRESMM